MTHEQGRKNVERLAKQVLELIEGQEKEELNERKLKRKVEEELEKLKREIADLEAEKDSLDVEILSLMLRDKAYQREHLELRNAITVLKFKIEKIEGSLERTRRRELEDLKEFERAVDEITEKFRSSPGIYDRRNLSQKLDEEREKRKLRLQRIQETREAYANFNMEKGLRERSNENEELLNCVLPGSELYYLIEMTKNLDEVVSGLRKENERVPERETELEELNRVVDSMIEELNPPGKDDEPAKTKSADGD